MNRWIGESGVGGREKGGLTNGLGGRVMGGRGLRRRVLIWEMRDE